MMVLNFSGHNKVCFRCGAKINPLEYYSTFETEDGRRVYLHRACMEKIAHDYCMRKLEGKK